MGSDEQRKKLRVQLEQSVLGGRDPAPSANFGRLLELLQSKGKLLAQREEIVAALLAAQSELDKRRAENNEAKQKMQEAEEKLSKMTNEMRQIEQKASEIKSRLSGKQDGPEQLLRAYWKRYPKN